MNAPAPEMITPSLSFEELKENFALLGTEDDEDFVYLIDLGRKLASLPESWKTDVTKVRGCLSKVWLVPGGTPQSFQFAADSDASIVKGLIAVLAVLVSGKPATEIAAMNIEDKFREVGIRVTPNRRNGFVAMVERIKNAARAMAEG